MLLFSEVLATDVLDCPHADVFSLFFFQIKEEAPEVQNPN